MRTQGTISADDAGNVQIGIGQIDGKIILNFGTPVSWIGFDPDQAEQIGIALFRRAKTVRVEQSKRLSDLADMGLASH